MSKTDHVQVSNMHWHQGLSFTFCLAYAATCVGASEARAQVLDTPGFNIRIEVRCAEGEIRCDDVVYRGQSKRTSKVLTLSGRTAHTKCADKVSPCRFLGYEFKSGNYIYFVSEEGQLTVRQGQKVIVNETGAWLDEAQ